MSSSTQTAVGRWSVSAALLLCLSLFYGRILYVNEATVAFSMLIYILVLAATWGLRYAVVVSFGGTVCFAYILPPQNSFTVADPKNWAALCGFLCTALIGSHLSNRIRQEAAKSEARRREIELLYQFGLRLFAKSSTEGLLRSIPRSIVSVFHVKSASIYLQETDTIFYSDPSAIHHPDHHPDHQMRIGRDRSIHQRSVPCDSTVLTLISGALPVGVLTLKGNLPSPETLIALSSMIDTSLENASAVERLALAASERASQLLRENWARSLGTEISEPLSAIRACVVAQDSLTARQRDKLLQMIDEETAHLTRLYSSTSQQSTTEIQ